MNKMEEFPLEREDGELVSEAPSVANDELCESIETVDEESRLLGDVGGERTGANSEKSTLTEF
jgi:hypothetical protein